MLPRKISEQVVDTGVTKVNTNQFIEVVKATVYSEEFKAVVDKYMQQTGKATLTSEEVLNIYSDFLKK